MTALEVLVLAAAIVGGGFWRRWWGDAEPSWAFSGYRWMEGALGFSALAGLGYLAGFPLWEAGLRSGIVLAILTTNAWSVPIIWDSWKRINDFVGTPRLGRWFEGWTTYAEATAGALAWAMAITL